MIKNNLFKYQLISPNLPVGGFCYSEGMESFLQKKNLKTDDSIKNLILDELKFGQIRIEAKSLIKFYELYNKLSNKDEIKDLKKEILSLNKFIIASRDSKEIRDQQNQMGKSLLDLSKNFGAKFPFEVENLITWPLAWSWACFSFEITKIEMVENFIYAWTSNQLSAAMRLIPLGSTKAQMIQYELLEIINKISQEIINKKISDIYVGNVGLSMAQQNHNDLYSKLFKN